MHLLLWIVKLSNKYRKFIYKPIMKLGVKVITCGNLGALYWYFFADDVALNS